MQGALWKRPAGSLSNCSAFSASAPSVLLWRQHRACSGRRTFVAPPVAMAQAAESPSQEAATTQGASTLGVVTGLRPCRVLGIGSAAPPTVLTNHDLAQFVDTNDEWISTRTGIKRRQAVKLSGVAFTAVPAAQPIYG